MDRLMLVCSVNALAPYSESYSDHICHSFFIILHWPSYSFRSSKWWVHSANSFYFIDILQREREREIKTKAIHYK